MIQWDKNYGRENIFREKYMYNCGHVVFNVFAGRTKQMLKIHLISCISLDSVLFFWMDRSLVCLYKRNSHSRVDGVIC